MVYFHLSMQGTRGIFMMNKRCALIIVLILMLSFSPAALAEGLEPLPMDSTAIAPPPKDECFLSD